MITGWVTHTQSTTYMRASRALVFPSLWYETLGLVVLEAASHGIPAIVPSESAAAEFVVDGITGLHFRRGDENDLRAQMLRLRDPELVGRLGRATYEKFWSAGFASRIGHAQALESVYRACLAKNPYSLQTYSVVTGATR